MNPFKFPIFRRLALAVVLITAPMQVRGGVTILFSPEPAGAARAIGIRTASLWAVRSCNAGEASITLTPERIFQAAPDVSFLETAEATLILQQSHARNRRVTIARYLEGAVVLATVLSGGGVVAASPKVIVSLGLSATAAHQIGDLIQGVAPDLTYLSSRLLAAPMTLAPGGCETRLALAAVQARAKPISVIID
jgi:hypothetical protein